MLAMLLVVASTSAFADADKGPAALADEVPVPFCTAGIATGKHLDRVLGLYEVAAGSFIADLVDLEAAAHCLKGTQGNLMLDLGSVQLNLDQGVSFTQLSGPQRRIVASTIDPVLCESYYGGNDQYALELRNGNGDLQGPGGLLGGIGSLTYNLATRTFTPALLQAAFGPFVRCHSATHANAEIAGGGIFNSGFEAHADLRVEYLDVSGSPIENLMQTIGVASVYKVRLSNVGEVAAGGVRLREFLATDESLSPGMEPVSCEIDGTGQSCAGSDGRLHQDIATLAAGETRTYTLTRNVVGSQDIGVESGALTAVTAFANPAVAADRRLNDNSRSLRVGLQSLPTFAVAGTVVGGNGGIAPGNQQVTVGGTANFTLQPNTNYVVGSVTDNCGVGGAPAGNRSGLSYSVPNIAFACTVTASYALQQHTVTASVSGGNGSIAPPSQLIDHGSVATFTVTPDAGYSAALSGCGGVANEGGGTWSTAAITGNCAVSASFSLNQYTVTPVVAGGNGSISPNIPQTVQHGGSVFFTLTPNSSYQIGSVTGCGGNLSGSNYLIANLQDNCTVTASFALVTYEITAAATSNGTISIPSPQVPHGSSGSFTVTPNLGYSTASVAGTPACGTLVDNGGGSWRTGPITGAGCQISATFSINQYTVTVTTSGGNGTIGDPPGTGPLSLAVDYGNSAIFDVAPDVGYEANVDGNPCLATDNGDGSWATDAITEDCAIAVGFALRQYTVLGIVASGPGTGTITPSRVIEHNDFGIFVLAPAFGHQFDSIDDTCGGGSLNGANTQYTVGPITSDCSVSVTYVPIP